MSITFDYSPIAKPMGKFFGFMRVCLVDFDISEIQFAAIRSKLLTDEWFDSKVSRILCVSAEVNEDALKASRTSLLMMIFKAYIAGLNEKHPMGPVCFCGVGLDHSQNRKNIAPP